MNFKWVSKALSNMSDDIFVKRVDFEVNNNQPILNGNGDGQNDVEKSVEIDLKPGCTTKFCTFLERFGIKSALSHIGLLFALGLFCLGGGWVSFFSVKSKLMRFVLQSKVYKILYSIYNYLMTRTYEINLKKKFHCNLLSWWVVWKTKNENSFVEKLQWKSLVGDAIYNNKTCARLQ